MDEKLRLRIDLLEGNMLYIYSKRNDIPMHLIDQLRCAVSAINAYRGPNTYSGVALSHVIAIPLSKPRDRAE